MPRVFEWQWVPLVDGRVCIDGGAGEQLTLSPVAMFGWCTLLQKVFKESFQKEPVSAEAGGLHGWIWRLVKEAILFSSTEDYMQMFFLSLAKKEDALAVCDLLLSCASLACRESMVYGKLASNRLCVLTHLRRASSLPSSFCVSQGENLISKWVRPMISPTPEGVAPALAYLSCSP